MVFQNGTNLCLKEILSFVQVFKAKMSNYFYVGLILLAFTSCGPTQKATETTPESEGKGELKNQPVFLFDSIIHYSIAIEEDTLWGIERIKDKTKDQRRLIEIVLYEKLDTFSDTTVLNELSNLGFTKHHLSNAKTETLRKVFYTQHMIEEEKAACVPIFRDILVFRLKSKNTGVMKLCFDCQHHTLDGELINTKQITQKSWLLLRETLKQ